MTNNSPREFWIRERDEHDFDDFGTVDTTDFKFTNHIHVIEISAYRELEEGRMKFKFGENESYMTDEWFDLRREAYLELAKFFKIPGPPFKGLDLVSFNRGFEAGYQLAKDKVDDKPKC